MPSPTIAAAAAAAACSGGISLAQASRPQHGVERHLPSSVGDLVVELEVGDGDGEILAAHWGFSAALAQCLWEKGSR